MKMPKCQIKIHLWLDRVNPVTCGDHKDWRLHLSHKPCILHSVAQQVNDIATYNGFQLC